MTRSVNTTYDVPYGDVTTAMGKFFQELGEDGEIVVARMKKDPVFVRRIANFVKAGGYMPSANQLRAQRIMGQFYIGPGAVMQHLGFTYTDEQFAMLANIPYSEDMLKACAKTHVLIAGSPFSILGILECVKGTKSELHSDMLFSPHHEKFETEQTVHCQWYLIRKEAVPESFNKSWDEQVSLLIADEIVSRACEVVYAIVLTKLTIGVRLFGKKRVRCSDVSSLGGHAYVRFSPTMCLSICCDRWDAPRDNNLGLAARWKMPSEI